MWLDELFHILEVMSRCIILETLVQDPLLFLQISYTAKLKRSIVSSGRRRNVVVRLRSDIPRALNEATVSLGGFVWG